MAILASKTAASNCRVESDLLHSSQHLPYGYRLLPKTGWRGYFSPRHYSHHIDDCDIGHRCDRTDGVVSNISNGKEEIHEPIASQKDLDGADPYDCAWGLEPLLKGDHVLNCLKEMLK